MKKFIITADGIKCERCAKKIVDGLSSLDSISEISVSVEDKSIAISVQEELSGLAVKKLIESLGYPVVSLRKGE